MVVSEYNLAVVLFVLVASISIFEVRKYLTTTRNVRHKAQELRNRALKLQTVLCEVSEIVSEIERNLLNDFHYSGSSSLGKTVVRGRSIISALYRRIEQVNALLNAESVQNVKAAQELLNRSLSMKTDCVDSLISDSEEDEEIPSSVWFGELRRIKRELLLVPLPKVA